MAEVDEREEAIDQASKQELVADQSSGLEVISGRLDAARDARDAHLATPEPSEFEADHADWMATRDELNAGVAEQEEAFAQEMEQAQPQQLQGFAALLANKRGQEPVGNGQEQPGDDQVMANDNFAAEEMTREGNNRGPAGRGYANYAATAQQEHQDAQNWQEREHAVRQSNLGQGSLTVEQIEQQEAGQAQAQPQQRTAEEQAQRDREEADWNARFLRGR